jgi:antibiotic biosynthesis monooxygenase (ABM) superfamily enzyme
MPLALRALVMSGVLVTLMVNLAMPLLSAGLARWLSRRAHDAWARGQPRPRSGPQRRA